MAAQLLIRIDVDEQVSWLALGADGRGLQAAPRAGWPSAAECAGAARVTLLVPAQDCLLLSAPRVARGERQLRQALPFAIEEQLVSPIEQMHVAHCASAAPGRVLVIAVAHERLRHWLAQAHGAGAVLDSVLPDGLCLPVDERRASLLAEDQRCILRHAEDGWLCGRTEELPATLALLADAGVNLPHLHVLLVEGTALPSLPDLSADATTAAHALMLLAEQLPQAAPLNLLQGEYAAQRRRDQGGRWWRIVALATAAVAVLALLHGVLELYALRRHDAGLQAQMQALLRDSVPDVGRVFDPPAQLASELLRVRGGAQRGGALPVLARVAPALAGSGQYVLDSLDYREGQLELTVRAPDLASLDTLRGELAAQGLRVELTAATPQGTAIAGRLRIRTEVQ